MCETRPKYIDEVPEVRSLTELGELPDFPRRFFSGWQVFALLLALLSLCYISFLVTSVATSDEYVQLWAKVTGSNWPQHMEIAFGRPMCGILTQILLSLTERIGDLRYIRLLSVITIAVLAWAIYRTLLQADWNWRDAFFISLILATLPPFQVAIWTPTGYIALAALSAAGAFYMAQWGLRERRPEYKWSLALGAVLLELLAITLYQPGAMFFWIFAAIAMFHPDANLRHLIRHLVWYGTIIAAGMILGFGVYQAGLARYGSMIPLERTHLTKDVLGKALWFIQEPMVDALNLVNLDSNSFVACGVLILGSCGLVLYFRGSLAERLAKFAIALFLIPISYLPNLLTSENWPSYRTQLALTSLILIYACFALFGYVRLIHYRFAERIPTSVLGLAVLAAMLLAAYNVQTYFVFPLSTELRMMRSQLISGDLKNAHSIYVIRCRWQDSMAPKVRYDEFGLPFSATPWGPEPAVHLLLRELGYPGVPVELAPVGGSMKPPEGALVVDMRKLASFR